MTTKLIRSSVVVVSQKTSGKALLFNSIEFLIFFLPSTLVVFYLSPPKGRPFVLALASAYFYGSSGQWSLGIVAWPFVFMILSVIWAYLTAFLYPYINRRLALLLAVFFPAATLYMFRYFGFTLNVTGTFDEVAPHFGIFLDVILPAGISFYSFQIMSYSIDLYDRKVETERNFVNLFAYIAFFPQLIAGPILRYEDLGSQIKRLREKLPHDVDWESCIKYLVVGLFFKIYVADRLATTIDRVHLDSAPIDVLYLIFSYSMRIYLDFWSYSVMAIGLAGMFGIKLPKNFLEPYLSSNPKEFWRRWHVTLSYWIRDYVYLRLGGRDAYIKNIFIIFLLVGIWHGAGFNFMVWGLYHAFLVMIYTLTRPRWDSLPSSLQIGLTFIFVSLGWPLFMFDLSTYASMMMQLVNLSQITEATQFGLFQWGFLALTIIFFFSFREEKWLDTPTGFFRFFHRPELYALVLFLCLIGTNWSRTFIYFRF